MADKIVLENTKCKLCGSKTPAHFLDCMDFQHGVEGKFTLVKCSKCGLVYQNPRPSEKTLALAYPLEYQPYSNFIRRKPEGWKFGLRKKLLGCFYNYPFKFGFQWKIILFPLYALQKLKKSKILPFCGKGRLLEIGCGTGEQLLSLQDLGWKAKGIEFSKDAAETGKRNGADITVGRIEDTQLKEKFDVVLMIYVFEHLSEPGITLDKIRKILDKNGRLVLDIPNIDSFESAIFKEKWFPLEMPRHFYQFSPATIRQMLEMHGFEVESILHDPTSKRFLQSLNYVLGTKGLEHNKFLSMLLFPLTYKFAFLGKGPIIRVTAKIM